MAFWNRTKPIDTALVFEEHHQLKKTLSWPHLIALGVGAIVGTGIYTLTGIAAGLAGPGMIFSFVICGVLCAAAALCYAEMATMVPASGSAYTFSYTALGELLAWVVGWALILEYAVGASAVAVGWSNHAKEFLDWAHIALPANLLTGPDMYGVITGHAAFEPSKALVNLPAVFIVLVVTGLLAIGTRESATVNVVLVLVKLAALIMFVVIALPHFDPANLKPLTPFGWGSTEHADHRNYGVLGAAGIVFFAFYGFDAVSTAAEETKNPEKDMTLGIVGSMVVCTAIYVAVAACALGAMYYTGWADNGAPLVKVLEYLNQPAAAKWLTVAVMVAIPTVILVLLYGQSRIFFAMARDGLLPSGMAKVNPKTKTPVLMTLIVGGLVAVVAGLFNLDLIAEMANAGTLIAFIGVALSVIILRLRDPNRARVFKVPLVWVIAPFCVLGCAYLFGAGLTTVTKTLSLYWGLIGLAIYLLYGAWKSKLAKS